jgi:hypothetical protein
VSRARKRVADGGGATLPVWSLVIAGRFHRWLTTTCPE